MSISSCIIVFIGFIYAYSLKLKVVRSFAENLLAPLIAILSAVLGLFNKDTIIAVLRVTFGVDATGPAIIASITFMLFLCVIPLIYLLKRRIVFSD